MFFPVGDRLSNIGLMFDHPAEVKKLSNSASQEKLRSNQKQIQIKTQTRLQSSGGVVVVMVELLGPVN
jgi:homoaconitase/3-isopropylmalate dehydratase large subunit